MFKVKHREFTASPKPKMINHKGEFPSRAAARNWCRNHSWYQDMTIVHPDGTREPYIKDTK